MWVCGEALMSYSHCPAACRKKAGLTQAAALNIDCLIPMAQLDESEISGLNGRNVRHWMNLLCLIFCYAANGARVNPDFEPQESAYVLILEHPGTKQHPSCLYQFKDNLAAYLQILHNQDPETPSEIIKLVPRLHLLLF